MNVLIYLVPMALALGLAGLAAFLWSPRTGQYEDMDGAALRVLSDDDLKALGAPKCLRVPDRKVVQGAIFRGIDDRRGDQQFVEWSNSHPPALARPASPPRLAPKRRIVEGMGQTGATGAA
jgi:cbb3-type cytochrome oxidase maturation protein